MALIFGGDDDFEISGPPEWTPNVWGLDQVVVPYRGSVEGLETFLGTHPVGEAYAGDANMFLMQKTPDGHLQFPTVRLEYQGKRGGTLPPARNGSSNPVQSATSSWGSTGPAIAPITIQFYAPTNTLSYITRAKGTTNADDPTDDIVVTQVVFNTVSFTGGSLVSTVALFFSEFITKEITTNEIVPGQYWQNTAKATKAYVPFLVNLPSGTVIIQLAAPGTNYHVGDILTIAGGGGTATLQVTNTGISNSIFAFITLSNTITATTLDLGATGGGGSGAFFNVILVS